MGSILEESKRSKTNGFFKITKIKIFFLLLIIFVSFIAYYFLYKKETKEVVVSQKEWVVKKDDLKISIEADGKVVAEDGVELSFSVSGDNLEVKDVFINEGDKIKKGDKIATVKTETLELNVENAYSNYLSAQADYNETINGASEEEILNAKDKITSAEISLKQSEISLENTKQTVQSTIDRAEDVVDDLKKDLEDAKEDLDDNKDELSSEDVGDAYEDLVDTIKDINISLDNILRESDEIVGIDKTYLNDDFESVLGLKDASALNQAKGTYTKSKIEFEKLNSLAIMLNFDSFYDEINQAAEQSVLALQEFEKHLYYMKLTLEATITFSNLSQNELDAFVSKISSNRATINSKITLLNSKIESVDDAKEKLEDYVDAYNDAKKELEQAERDLFNEKADAKRDIENAEANLESKKLSLEQVKRDYDDLLAPLTESEKSSAISKLTSASINLKKVRNELENATIISPIDGEVARLNYKAGDIIVDQSSADSVATIINNDSLFIEVNIEEADIGKIEKGQLAYVSFDSLDDLTLKGEVSYISLTSETDNSGIVTYLVRIVILDKGENKIREGMTAFVDFVTAEAKDVLVVPVASVSNVNNSPSVMNSNGEWLAVVTGFTDGKYVEIIKGLNIGDKIVYEK